MAEPDMHAGVGERRWRRRAIGRGRERGRKKRSANAGCVLAHVRGLGWVALAWLTEVEVEVVAGQSKSKLRGAGELGSWADQSDVRRRQGFKLVQPMCVQQPRFLLQLRASRLSENLALTRALRCQVVTNDCRDFLLLPGNKWLR
jgi:hypothetical protein